MTDTDAAADRSPTRRGDRPHVRRRADRRRTRRRLGGRAAGAPARRRPRRGIRPSPLASSSSSAGDPARSRSSSLWQLDHDARPRAPCRSCRRPAMVLARGRRPRSSAACSASTSPSRPSGCSSASRSARRSVSSSARVVGPRATWDILLRRRPSAPSAPCRRSPGCRCSSCGSRSARSRRSCSSRSARSSRSTRPSRPRCGTSTGSSSRPAARSACAASACSRPCSCRPSCRRCSRRCASRSPSRGCSSWPPSSSPRRWASASCSSTPEHNGRVDRILLAIILLALLGKLTDSILGLFERWAVRRWA